MTHKNFNRNKQIAKRVLNGEKLISVGIDFELSEQGIIRAVHAYCKLANKNLYAEIPTDRYERKMQWLSARKEQFGIQPV